MVSPLQQYILISCFLYGKDRVPREIFLQYYTKTGDERQRVKVVTRSIERLIERGYLVGYGIRTPKKWFIQQVRLTDKGKRAARELLSTKQQAFPFEKE